MDYVRNLFAYAWNFIGPVFWGAARNWIDGTPHNQAVLPPPAGVSTSAAAAASGGDSTSAAATTSAGASASPPPATGNGDVNSGGKDMKIEEEVNIAKVIKKNPDSKIDAEMLNAALSKGGNVNAKFDGSTVKSMNVAGAIL